MSFLDDIEMIEILKKSCVIQDLTLTGDFYIRILDETPKEYKDKIKEYFVNNRLENIKQQKIDEIRGV